MFLWTRWKYFVGADHTFVRQIVFFYRTRAPPKVEKRFFLHVGQAIDQRVDQLCNFPLKWHRSLQRIAFAVGPALGHCKFQQIKTSMAPMWSWSDMLEARDRHVSLQQFAENLDLSRQISRESWLQHIQSTAGQRNRLIATCSSPKHRRHIKHSFIPRRKKYSHNL